MMGYPELHAAADKLIIPEDIRDRLKKPGGSLCEYDFYQVDEYLHHAVVIGLAFANRAAKRIVSEKITLPCSALRPMCYYVASEISESDWLSELRSMAKSGEMLNFIDAELKAMAIAATVRWRSRILSEVPSLITREHGHSSIDILSVEEILKLVFSNQTNIAYDRIVGLVNDAVVEAWSRRKWLKERGSVAEIVRGVLSHNRTVVIETLHYSTSLMGLDYIFELDDSDTREFLVEAIAEGVWKRVKNGSEGNDGN